MGLQTVRWETNTFTFSFYKQPPALGLPGGKSTEAKVVYGLRRQVHCGCLRVSSLVLPDLCAEQDRLLLGHRLSVSGLLLHATFCRKHPYLGLQLDSSPKAQLTKSVHSWGKASPITSGNPQSWNQCQSFTWVEVHPVLRIAAFFFPSCELLEQEPRILYEYFNNESVAGSKICDS